MEAMLTFTNVSYFVGDTQILTSVSLDIPRGARVMITGPSGSGKSTLLRLAGGFSHATSGTISVDGTDQLAISPVDLHSRVGMCFQTPTLFGVTVRDNLEFPFLTRSTAVDETTMRDLLTAVGLDVTYLDRKHQDLSGGERQRIALARALVIPPSVLLLDEVTSALDTESSSVIEQLVLRLNQGDGLTVVWVSHNADQVARIGTHELRIEAGEVQWMRELDPNPPAADASDVGNNNEHQGWQK